MRLPSAGGTGDGGHCCRCAVLGASFFYVLGSVDWAKNYEDETRHSGGHVLGHVQTLQIACLKCGMKHWSHKPTCHVSSSKPKSSAC